MPHAMIERQEIKIPWYSRAAMATAVAALIATLSGLSGCADGARERALRARADVVLPSEGSGAVRLATWPALTDPAATARAAAPSGWDTFIGP